MAPLSTVQSALSQLSDGPPLVAAFVGGTSGYTVKALANSFSKHGKKLRVYIIGRNMSAAEEIIADTKKTSPGSEWHFVKAGNL
jgi:hypothetical protein